MLTPLGRGGHLRRHRRRWPRVLLIVVVVVAVVLAGYFAWQWWQGRNEATPSAGPSTTPTQVCHTPKPPKAPTPLPSPSTIDVEVLNGSNQSGLALTTADALANAGFTVIGFGNSGASPPVPAIVRYPKGQLGPAVTVASYLPDARLRQAEQKAGATSPTSVVVILGDGFTQVRSSTEAAAAAQDVPIPTPSPVCR
jgi:hypothetical protein